MLSPDPLVTIVICTRNRGSRLHQVLEALARIESQIPWDVLMVDNASTDNTAEVIQAFDKLSARLQYAHAERIGLGAARDYAWRLAKGDIVAFTDDDCYPAPDFVDAIADAFERHPDAGLIGGRILLFDPTDVELAVDMRDEPSGLPAFSYLAAGTYHGANLAVRKIALAKVGGFDPSLGAGTPFPCEDIDVAAAITWAGFPTRFDPAPVVYHHHGRKEADLDRLMQAYDAGRGAYYAKYLMRPDTRTAFAVGWAKRLLRHRNRWGLTQYFRELRAGQQYALSRGKRGFVVAAAPFAAVGLALALASITARGLKRALSACLRLPLGFVRGKGGASVAQER